MIADCALVFLLAVGLFQEGGQESVDATGQEVQIPAMPALAVQDELSAPQPFSIQTIETRLAELVAGGAGLATLETIGISRGGLPIRVLALNDPATGPAGDKPAVLVFAHGARGDTTGAEAILALGAELLKGAVNGGAHGLSACTVYLAAALNPDDGAGPVKDATSGVEARRRARFDLNFPRGWRPDSLRPGSGDYPLSEPETLALAEFLAAHANLSMVVGFQTDSEAAGSTAVAGGKNEPHWVRLDRDDLKFSGGGFFEYAYEAFGMVPFVWGRQGAEFKPEAEYGANAREATVRHIAREIGELFATLPRLVMAQDSLSEIAPGLWRLDLALSNAGSLPTESMLGRRRSGARGIRLALSGAELLASARREALDDGFQVQELCGEEGQTTLGDAGLRGGEQRWVRLVLKAERGSSIELTAVSVRGGTVRLAITLE